MAEIQSLSIRHEDILNFVLANPQMKLGDVALLHGVTQPWLSTVIHSDCFQAKLSERQDDIFADALLPISDKLTALAHAGLDSMLENIPFETDSEVVRKTTDTVLKSLGFSGDGAGNGQNAGVINNTYVVQASILEKARDKIGSRRPPVTLDQSEGAEVTHEPTETPTPQGISSGRDSNLGGTIPSIPPLPETAETQRSQGQGHEV